MKVKRINRIQKNNKLECKGSETKKRYFFKVGGRKTGQDW